MLQKNHEKKIKLAIVRQNYKIDGGGEQFILSILQALNHSNIELNIITRKWPRNIPNLNYNIHIRNPYIWNRLSKETEFAKSVFKYCQKKFHIIQSHERIPHCDILRVGDGVHKAWLKQWNRILPRHRYLSHKISKYHKYILTTEKKIFQEPTLKKIICNSNMVKNDIIHMYNIKENKINLIYNSVNSKKFYPADTEEYYKSKQKLQIPKKACTLIYVGSGFERKGLRQVIYAFALTNRYLIIVGNDRNIEQYKSLTKTLGCFYRTRFIGISNNILPYYHASDALILPTLYDPFPNVILEAMSCALPIITSWQSGGAELIQTEKEGFTCDALDINNLQKFILEIPLKNEQPSMGITARKKIITLNSENLAKKLTKLYKNIIPKNNIL